MKRILCLCVLLCLGASLVGAAPGEAEFRVVTSFYPMYVLTANVVEGMEGVSLVNMTAPETGCLHDYQLLPADLRAVADADVFIINGAGMESFLDKVTQQYAQMPIVDVSVGIDLMYEEGHVHEAADDSHEHGEEMPNGHLWLDPRNAATQVRNIAEGLAAADPARADEYRANAEAYAQELERRYQGWTEELAALTERRLVTFHDAFPYFARAFDLEILATLHVEGDEQPGTRELMELTDLVKAEGITALFTEPQYDAMTATIISRETGAKPYVLDPLVTGELVPEAYIAGMEQNIQTLKEALSK